MEVGKELNAIALGHQGIDVKGLLLSFGYIMPQGSSASLPKLPGEVEAEISKQKESQKQYETLDESKIFQCQFCQTNNSTNWKKEVSTNIEFLACGECHKVVEVK